MLVFYILPKNAFSNTSAFGRELGTRLVRPGPKVVGPCFKLVHNEHRGDRELVLEAVRRNGFALEHAAEDRRRDRELVIEAMKTRGMALSYASLDLRLDREVVLTAVRNTGMALAQVAEHDKANHLGLTPNLNKTITSFLPLASSQFLPWSG